MWRFECWAKAQQEWAFKALLTCHEWFLLFVTEHDMQMLPEAVAHLWVFQSAKSVRNVNCQLFCNKSELRYICTWVVQAFSN